MDKYNTRWKMRARTVNQSKDIQDHPQRNRKITSEKRLEPSEDPMHNKSIKRPKCIDVKAPTVQN